MSADTLVILAGAANANAYCDLTFADQYHANRPPSGVTWASASTDQKTAAILWATLLMDRLWDWTGWVVTVTQALMWPRQGMLLRNGWGYVDTTIIPTEIKQATAEYARQLLVSDIAGNSDVETQGVKAFTAGPVSFTFKDGVTAKPMPDTVVYLIPSHWGVTHARSAGVRKVARA
jgi:DNA mismatch repair protein MutH